MAGRYVSIAPPQKKLFELRLVVWDAVGMKAMDSIGSMNDLFISGTLAYRNSCNELVEQVRTTDVHWRAKNGKGNFNHRLIWTDLELPMDINGALDSSDDSTGFPRFTLKAWDRDIIGSNDLIGSGGEDTIFSLLARLRVLVLCVYVYYLYMY